MYNTVLCNMFKYLLLTSILWLFRQLVQCFATVTAAAAALVAMFFALGVHLLLFFLVHNINCLVFLCVEKLGASRLSHYAREIRVFNAITPDTFTSDLVTRFCVCLCLYVPLLILSLLIIRDTLAAMLLFLSLVYGGIDNH